MSIFEVDCIDLNIQTPTVYFGRFVFKPLDSGNAITIGNVLRRVLLMDLPGISIVGVKITGINHEFSTIKGVREDVLEILLNLKEVIFKSLFQEKGVGRLKVQGPAIVTASCMELPPFIELVNPNQYIATIADNSILEMEIHLDWGKGYTLGENISRKTPIDLLKLDAVFMPVRKVLVNVEPFNMERINTQELLILDIWTNGSITPIDAINLAAKRIIQWFQILDHLEGPSLKKEALVKEENIEMLPIEKLKLSTRSYNALKRSQINVVGELLKYSLKDLQQIKNFGPKSIQEILKILETTYELVFNNLIFSKTSITYLY